MPQADAMVLVARNYERYKTESREKEREEIARQAAKMADEAVLQERERPPPVEEGARGGHPPAIQTLLNLLADNRYLTAEETDKVINYLRDRKERLLRGSTDSLQGKLCQPQTTLLIVWLVGSPGWDRTAVLALQRGPSVVTLSHSDVFYGDGRVFRSAETILIFHVTELLYWILSGKPQCCHN